MRHFMVKRYGVEGLLAAPFSFGTTYSEGLLVLPVLIDILLYIRFI